MTRRVVSSALGSLVLVMAGLAMLAVSPEGADIKVAVELRDQNYPGCLYKLTYLADKDRLVGTYFQAQMQQTYEVEFVREP